MIALPNVVVNLESWVDPKGMRGMLEDESAFVGKREERGPNAGMASISCASKEGTS